MKKKLVIFTDLDSTLLDHRSYSFEKAREALELIYKENIPLIFCTSKTRLETEFWRKKMNNHHPFIVENGAAIYIPERYFPFNVPGARNFSTYHLLELGQPYEKLRQFLLFCRQHFAPSVRGFGDMSLEEVMVLTGLPADMASLAIQREYDEPFIIKEEKELRLIQKEAARAGYKILTGSRFHHLTGHNDKGQAVRLLKDLYMKFYGAILSAGIGDSHNDLAMLEAVDRPFLVQKDDGSYDPQVKVSGLWFTSGIGPEGWKEAVLFLIKNLE